MIDKSAYQMENFLLIYCTSWLLSQNQWLEIVLRTPQHHGEALQSLFESKLMTELWPRSPSVLFLIKKIQQQPRVSLFKHLDPDKTNTNSRRTLKI